MVKQTKEQSGLVFFNMERSSLDILLTCELGDPDGEDFFTEKECVNAAEF